MKTLKSVVVIAVLFFGFTANAQDKVITMKDLPETAQKFIATHFGKLTPSLISSDTDYLVVKEYEVVFAEGTKIEFKSSGEWKEIKTKQGELPASVIPEGISTYVKKAFPNTQIAKIEKESFGYEIKLSNGVEVDFDSKGNFKRIDQ